MLEERLFENAPFKILNMNKTLVVGMDHLTQLFYFFITNLKVFIMLSQYQTPQVTKLVSLSLKSKDVCTYLLFKLRLTSLVTCGV